MSCLKCRGIPPGNYCVTCGKFSPPFPDHSIREAFIEDVLAKQDPHPRSAEESLARSERYAQSAWVKDVIRGASEQKLWDEYSRAGGVRLRHDDGGHMTTDSETKEYIYDFFEKVPDTVVELNWAGTTWRLISRGERYDD